MNEQKYAKAKREPLGKSIMRNYSFPDSVKEDNFKFGINTGGGNIKNKIINIKKFQF